MANAFGIDDPRISKKKNKKPPTLKQVMRGHTAPVTELPPINPQHQNPLRGTPVKTDLKEMDALRPAPKAAKVASKFPKGKVGLGLAAGAALGGAGYYGYRKSDKTDD